MRWMHTLAWAALVGCRGADEPVTDTDDSVGCDSEVASWFADWDGDGYGAAGDFACEPRDGYVVDSTDCDDRNPRVNPGATEDCDERDDDCDGQVDDDATDADTWYADADQDGLGDPATPTIACDAPSGYVDNDDDCDDADAVVGRIRWHRDADGDGYGARYGSAYDCEPISGYVADSTDCDDTDAFVHPGGTETCNSVDDDCDGAVDDGVYVPTWYADADGDGHGDPGTSAAACDAPPGFVAPGTDCDDAHAYVSPDVDEYCNGFDDDCDGLVDYDDPGNLGGVTWYADTDGDGWGDPATATIACLPGAGWALESGDCDDGASGVNPSATELCANGVDDDCDGGFSDCVLPAASAGAKVYGAEADGYCGEVAGIGDVDGDGQADVAVGCWGTSSGDGVVHVLPAGLTGTAEITTVADATLTGSGGEYAGFSLAALGDVDGDGVQELAVGAYNWGTYSTGVVYLLSGDVASGTLSSAATATLVGDFTGLGTGYALDAGDVDGDGTPEVVVGAPCVNWSASTYCMGGYVYLVPASASGNVYLGSSAGETRIYDTSYGGVDYAGRSVAAADHDGDGRDDVFIGAPEYMGPGYVYVFSDPGSGDVDLIGDADARLSSAVYFGYSVHADGDLDGDGYNDAVLPGAGSWSSDGATYVFAGPVRTGTETSAAWTFETYGAGTTADFDGDGNHDLAIASGSSVHLYYGNLAPGSYADTDADSEITAEATTDGFGSGLAVLDRDGDGVDDLVVGAAYESTGATAAGAVYFFSSGGL